MLTLCAALFIAVSRPAKDRGIPVGPYKGTPIPMYCFRYEACQKNTGQGVTLVTETA